MTARKSTHKKNKISAIVEAMLLAHGEPITVAKLAKVSGFSATEIAEAITALKSTYSDRGIIILEKNGEVQLGTNPFYTKYVEDLLRGEFTGSLSRAALETLAIIAYKGPIIRTSIDFIRGVNSSFIVRNLAMRGLIERAENYGDARSHWWRISFDFLKYIGVTKVEDLPEFVTLHKEEIAIPDVVSPVEVLPVPSTSSPAASE